MAWTNGEYKSSRHRVVLNSKDSSNEEEDEEEGKESQSRLSLVWFHCPNYDALIDSREVEAKRIGSSSTRTIHRQNTRRFCVKTGRTSNKRNEPSKV